MKFSYTSIVTLLLDNIKAISSLLTILDVIVDIIHSDLFVTNLNNIIHFVHWLYCFPILFSLHSLLFRKASVCVKQMHLWSSSSADVYFSHNEFSDLTYSGCSKSKHYKDSFITFICTIKTNRKVDKWATKNCSSLSFTHLWCWQQNIKWLDLSF